MRRRLLLSAGLLASVGVPAQTFRGDAARRGVLAASAPGLPPKVKWSFPTGDRIVSSPALRDGLLFFGSDDGHLYAVDVAGGRERWRLRTGGPVSSSPAVAGGRVFFASYDGKVYAADEKTGALQWRYNTGGERRFEARGLHGWMPRQQTYADPYDVFLSSPVVVGGVVYLGSGDGHLHALDAASGRLRWKFAGAEVIHASPAYADGLVYVGDWASRLYAVDAATGAQRWRFQAGTDDLIHNQVGFQSSPAVVDGVVYVGCRDSNLYAIDARSGSERWRFPNAGSWVVCSPAVANGRVIFATSDSSLLHAVDAASGKALWQQSTQAYVFSSPTVVGDLVLVGVLNGSLQARDLATGNLRWDWRSEASQANSGWVLGADRRFNSSWNFPSPWREKALAAVERQFGIGAFFSTPLVSDGVIYVGNADGRMLALE